MSCNGCRVLRKGCSDTCILRSSLQWIESPEAQGHATVFVAKFFGRAGMISFISAVSESQRPALFQSLLYEACGRTVNPVFGAVGLLWSGNWGVCQAAVETVLKGGSLRPAVACLPTLSPNLTHPLALRSNPPPHAHPSSTPIISFNPSLKRPQSAEPAITETPPIKRIKVPTHPQEPLKEASNLTSEAATSNQEHANGLVLKQSRQESSHPKENFVIKHQEGRPMGTGQVHAPVPRRVRPHIMHTVSSAVMRGTACEEEATLREESHGTIELDLTLNSHANLADACVWKMGSPALMRVSSPSSFSVNSECSVTTSDTAEYSMSCLRTLSVQGHHDRKLLHLL